MRIQIPEAFEPLFQPNRYKVYYGGRGGAKSWGFARALLLMAAQKPLRVLCAREMQNSIEESVHKLLAEQIEDLGLQGVYDIQKTHIRGVNGSEFLFQGLWRNVNTIKSMEGIDICWVEEADKVSEHSWKVLIPTIRKAGSEIWVSFNPNLKTDATYQRFIVNPPPGALVRKVSWRDNPWFPQELRDEMEHLKSVDYDEYRHIWEGELKHFADGAVYGKQLRDAYEQGRITEIPIESSIPVNTFWDLGRNDTTAIWFHQRVGLENRFIDYYECRLVDLEHYVKVLRDKDYLYGTHYLPHDVEVTELTAKASRREILERAGVKPLRVVPRISSVNEGIEMTRQVFPTCYFDRARCEQGISALSNYKWVWDDKYVTYRPIPLHDWASNGSDAFRQFGQGYRPMSVVDETMSERRKQSIRRNKRPQGMSHIV